jgi:hypothetical protein
MSDDNVLSSLDISDTDIAMIEDWVSERKRFTTRDGRICICGHPITYHRSAEICMPAKMTCPCRMAVPVLKSEDTRFFLRKTDGPGALHALTRGIVASALKEKKVEWIETPACEYPDCESPEGVKVIPVPINNTVTPPRISYKPMRVNKFLCETCRIRLEQQ